MALFPAFGIGAGILLVAVLILVRKWLGVRQTARTVARIGPALLEHDSFFALLDLSGADSHFLERHGPLLRASEIMQRAETGRLEGLEGRPVASARWLRHDDLLTATVSALQHWRSGARPKGGRFAFEFERHVGEGFVKGGGDLVRTRRAIVIVRDGELITAYPSLTA